MAGSLVSSLLTSGLGDTPHKGRLLLISGLVSGAALLGMALLPIKPLPFVMVFVYGATYSMGRVMQITVLQAHADPEYRGRVNSLARALGGLVRLWTLPAGALAHRFGVSLALGIQGVLALAVFAVIGVSSSKVRNLV